MPFAQSRHASYTPRWAKLPGTARESERERERVLVSSEVKRANGGSGRATKQNGLRRQKSESKTDEINRQADKQSRKGRRSHSKARKCNGLGSGLKLD